jgi:Ser/Thr protein kinase RdoA (MazF antagonist)
LYSSIAAIASQFADISESTIVSPMGNGLINQTFRIDCDKLSFVIQCINTQVFPNPEYLMLNLRQLQFHMEQLQTTPVDLQIPKLISTLDQQLYFKDYAGNYWRALQLIQPAESRERLNNISEAEQVGFALAKFHSICSGLPTHLLHDTLPGFHITPSYFQIYQTLINQSLDIKVNTEFHFCQRFIKNFEAEINILENAKSHGRLVERVIHGDPKLNNFLFAPNTNKIIGLIDLDTVKPGLIHYDIGDCIRSCCHIMDSNDFDMGYCQAILTSYLKEAGHFLHNHDFDYLYPAIKLIPFELGLRFFSDFLNGNRYFKIDDAEHNLRRAVAQFELCQSINRQQRIIEKMIAELKNICLFEC